MSHFVVSAAARCRVAWRGNASWVLSGPVALTLSLLRCTAWNVFCCARAWLVLFPREHEDRRHSQSGLGERQSMIITTCLHGHQDDVERSRSSTRMKTSPKIECMKNSPFASHELESKKNFPSAEHDPVAVAVPVAMAAPVAALRSTECNIVEWGQALRA